jgi:hypothetical protein
MNSIGILRAADSHDAHGIERISHLNQLQETRKSGLLMLIIQLKPEETPTRGNADRSPDV